MRITVLVKPKSSKESLTINMDGSYSVTVKEPPVENRANQAVIRLIAECFGVPVSQVAIVSGAKFKRKILEISGI